LVVGDIIEVSKVTSVKLLSHYKVLFTVDTCHTWVP